MPIAGWSFGPDAELEEEALLDEVLVEVIPLDVGIVFFLQLYGHRPPTFKYSQK